MDEPAAHGPDDPTPRRPHRLALRSLGLAVALAALIVTGTASPAMSPVSAATSVTAAVDDAPKSARVSLTATSASPAPWHVVALGDSVVSGGPCDCWAFPGRYARLVTSRTGHPTTARNLGVGGATSRDLLTSLAPGSAAARALSGADIVTVTIGANDLVPARWEWQDDGCRGCFDRAADAVGSTLERIVRQVRADVGPTPVEVIVTTYWNVFKEPATHAAAAGRSSSYDIMARRATLLTNSAICTAAARTGAVCAGLFAPFKGDGSRDARGLLDPDLDHPNASGHQLIATTLAAHGWRWVGP